jgi:hypothetical protein
MHQVGNQPGLHYDARSTNHLDWGYCSNLLLDYDNFANRETASGWLSSKMKLNVLDLWKIHVKETFLIPQETLDHRPVNTRGPQGFIMCVARPHLENFEVLRSLLFLLHNPPRSSCKTKYKI